METAENNEYLSPYLIEIKQRLEKAVTDGSMSSVRAETVYAEAIESERLYRRYKLPRRENTL